MHLQQPKNAFPACKVATLCYVYIVRAQGKHRKSEEEISDRKPPPPSPPPGNSNQELGTSL